MAKAKAKKPARKPYTAQAALKGKNASIKNRETNEKIRRITEAESIEARSRFRPSAVIREPLRHGWIERNIRLRRSTMNSRVDEPT